ncbi:MAG: hypothetical protein AAB352_01385 [Patescibacteria group bacterium]
MSETPREQESILPDKVLEVEPIEVSRGTIIKIREQIKELVEAPLLSACEELYDKNIQTSGTSANKKDIESHMPGYIVIVFDSLSDKNKEIAKQFGKAEKFEFSDDPCQVKIEIPLNENSSAEEIKTYAEAVAHKFFKQRMTWAPHFTIEELREAYAGDPNDESITIEELEDTYYYDPQSKLFYLSEEHFRKVNEKIED